ncbi:hypothetical protein JN27_00380 [Massilia sp. BSC265]|nr:hypothetical protein JN27_00380 [Massilia sp. BSC265]
MAFGNIIFGGVVWAGVDVASGAAYDYPNLFQIMISQTALAPAAAPGTAQADAIVPAQAAAGGSN